MPDNEITTHEVHFNLSGDGSFDVILLPVKPYTADELSTMWPKLRLELLAYSQILEREPTVEHAQVRVGIKAAVQMGDGYMDKILGWGIPYWSKLTDEDQCRMLRDLNVLP